MVNNNSTLYRQLKYNILTFIHRLQSFPYYVRLTVLIGLVLFLISAYYYSLWGSTTSFVGAIDHNNQLFQDFLEYYHPMSKTILQSPTPISGYYYSAFFAILLIPLGILKTSTAIWSWGAIQTTGIVLLYILPLIRLSRLKPIWIALYTGVFATSFPLLHNMQWGQMSVIIVVCIIAAFHAYGKNQRILAGIILAFAASIKYYPILFILYFILKRDLRVIISFAIAGIFFYILFPAVIIGPESLILFETSIFNAVSGAEWISTDINSQYFAHVVARWSHFESGILLPFKPGVIQALTISGYAIFICNMAILWLLQRKKLRNQLTLSLILLFLSLPFVIKTSWPHYFSYLAFCQVTLFAHLKSYRSSLLSWRELPLLLLPIFSIAFSSMFVFNAFPHWSYFSAYGLIFLANLLLLISFYLIILKEIAYNQTLESSMKKSLPEQR